jgi:hypothetical protein
MNFHRPLIASLISLSFIAPATANDSSYYASGNQIIPLQETDISIKKEVLTIKRIKDNKVRITVDYTFHNPGKEKTILMGFEATSPSGDVNDSPRDGEHRYIENFTVKINDQSVPHKIALLTPAYREDREKKALYTLDDLKKNLLGENRLKTGNLGDYYVYHFPATFPSGETRVVHTYHYAISSAVLTITSIDYLLTPALRWANQQIDDFTLIIDLGEFQEYHIYPTFFENLDGWTTQGRVKIGMENVKHAMSDETRLMMTVWQHHGSVSFHAKNFKPKGELDLFANHFIPDYVVIDAAQMRLSLQTYPWLGELELQNEFTRKVLENLPYARRGYVFKNKELKAFYDKQPWYIPDPDYKDISLTKEETEWLGEVRQLKITTN